MAGEFKGGSDDDVVAAINMVPMIDVVLVLLIIFIVTASAIVKAAIAVDLPKSATSETAANPPMSITLGCVEKQEGTETNRPACTPGPVLVDGEQVLDLSKVDRSDPERALAGLLSRVEARQAEADEAARAEGKDKGELTVLITADKDVRFQIVIWMMDILKNEGVSGIMFNSELFTRASDARQLPN